MKLYKLKVVIVFLYKSVVKGVDVRELLVNSEGVKGCKGRRPSRGFTHASSYRTDFQE